MKTNVRRSKVFHRYSIDDTSVPLLQVIVREHEAVDGSRTNLCEPALTIQTSLVSFFLNRLFFVSAIHLKFKCFTNASAAIGRVLQLSAAIYKRHFTKSHKC